MAVQVSGETLPEPDKGLDPHFVASAFVKQYYVILEKSPEIVHKFYTDQSVIDRPGTDGEMTSVTTMQDINETIMSSDYRGCLAEILNVDAQESLNGGIIVAVNGYFIGNDSLRKSFYQTFFLAKQERGFFVLNDILRFLDAHETLTPAASIETEKNTSTVLSNDTQGTCDTPGHPEPTNECEVEDDTKKLPDVKDLNSSAASIETEKNTLTVLSNDTQGTVDTPGHPEPTNECEAEDDTTKLPDVKDSHSSDAPIQNEVTTTKASYASMVTKPIKVTSPTRPSASTVVSVAPTAVQQPKSSPILKSPRIVPSHTATKDLNSSNNSTEHNSSNGDDVALRSVYIGNLPSNITKSGLLEAVKVFGRVRQDSVQLRTFEDGFCFGFVEFESASSARNAVEVRNLTIGENGSYITYKRSVGRSSNRADIEPRNVVDGFSRPRNGGGGGGRRGRGESYNDRGSWSYRRIDDRRSNGGEAVYRQKRDERVMNEEEGEGGGYQRRLYIR